MICTKCNKPIYGFPFVGSNDKLCLKCFLKTIRKDKK